VVSRESIAGLSGELISIGCEAAVVVSSEVATLIVAFPARLRGLLRFEGCDLSRNDVQGTERSVSRTLD
jgi:hypothetical protein